MKNLVLYIKDKLLCYKILSCPVLYHECERTWYVYMYFHVFLVTIGIDNDHIILFISRAKV